MMRCNLQSHSTFELPTLVAIHRSSLRDRSILELYRPLIDLYTFSSRVQAKYILSQHLWTRWSLPFRQ